MTETSQPVEGVSSLSSNFFADGVLDSQTKEQTMKTAVLASLIAGAAAFSTSSQNAATTVLKAFDAKQEVGVIQPTGFFGTIRQEICWSLMVVVVGY